MNETSLISRDAPKVESPREALVKEWVERINRARKCHETAFNRMREDMRFAANRKGEQWSDGAIAGDERKYVANITQRHVAHRVATLYAKNPRARAKRRQRLDFQFWDGKPESLMMAQQALAAPPLDAMGQPVMDASAMQSAQLLAEVQQVQAHRQMLDRVGKTLESLFHYFIDEQEPRFKPQAKQLVRRTVTCGVGYVEIGFQRAMDKDESITSQIMDASRRLATMEAMSADLADKQIDYDGPETEKLRLMIDDLKRREDVIVREGLVFDFPKSTSVIIDPACTQLVGFVGAAWIAREYHYSMDAIKRIYAIDVGEAHAGYSRTPSGDYVRSPSSPSDQKHGEHARAWRVWDKDSGLEFHICEGYPDFLREPSAPRIDLERFFPIFALTFNDLENDDDMSGGMLFPPSDVRLIMPMQREHNRSREALREHRIASTPYYLARRGALEKNDRDSIRTRVAHGITEINPVVDDVTKAFAVAPSAPIDPNLYETGPVFEDILRVSGTQEANLGGTSGDTATEASIAETSRMSTQSSNVDEFDELLTDLARAAGQIMLANMSVDQVKKIVGPGAAWPEMSREQIAEEIYLEIKAGSSGRPNRAQDIANLERIAPIATQVPGINPMFLARKVVEAIDDTIDLDEAILDGMPSLIALNAASKTAATPNAKPGKGNPEEQGARGGDNSERPQQSAPGPQPAFPAAGEVVPRSASGSFG
jgi:hypothetical protein